jgi:hypothetical protein
MLYSFVNLYSVFLINCDERRDLRSHKIIYLKAKKLFLQGSQNLSKNIGVGFWLPFVKGKILRPERKNKKGEENEEAELSLRKQVDAWMCSANGMGCPADGICYRSSRKTLQQIDYCW